MLGWLLAFSIVLASLFAYLVFGGGDLGALGALPMAGAVALVLLALYAVATRGGPEGGWRRLAGLLVGLSVLGSAAYYAAPHIDLAALAARLSGASVAAGNGAESGNGFKSVRIRRNDAGQFLARGSINGTPAQFLIDTGSSAIVLRQSEAEKAGVSTAALTFSVPIETANGQTKAAPVRLRSLSVGTIHLEGVEALVAAPGSLNENLLGQSFLRRLRSYEMAGDFITLRE